MDEGDFITIEYPGGKELDAEILVDQTNLEFLNFSLGQKRGARFSMAFRAKRLGGSKGTA